MSCDRRLPGTRPGPPLADRAPHDGGHEPCSPAGHRAGCRRRGRARGGRHQRTRPVCRAGGGPRRQPRAGACADPFVGAGLGPRGLPRAVEHDPFSRPRRAAHPQPQDRGDGSYRRPPRRRPGRGQHLPRLVGPPRGPAGQARLRVRAGGAGCALLRLRVVPERRRPRHPAARPQAWPAPGGGQRGRPRAVRTRPARAARRVRAELGVADDELLVGTIGRRVREKGLAEFAEAADALAGKATFVWVGPDDDTDAAAHVPHEGAIRFLGERTDMPAVYSALDVFVLASYREGFSRASMEAAACGTAMVLTDIRGCREVGEDGVHLLLAPPHDGVALTRAVERLLADPDLRSRLGAAARQRALAAFDQREVARVSLETYERRRTRRKGEADAPTAARSDDARLTVLHVLPADQDRGAQVYAGQLRDALAGDPDQRHLVVSLFDAPEAALRADIRLGVRSGLLRRVGLDPAAVARLRRAIREPARRGRGRARRRAVEVRRRGSGANPDGLLQGRSVVGGAGEAFAAVVVPLAREPGHPSGGSLRGHRRPSAGGAGRTAGEAVRDPERPRPGHLPPAHR